MISLLTSGALCLFFLGCSGAQRGGISQKSALSDSERVAFGFSVAPILKVSGYTQEYPANVRKVFENRYGFKEQQEATLVYTFRMNDGFEFVKGGKLPGLGGGDATTGCDSVESDGWSMRFMWRRGGRAVVYAYHQDRENRCGDDWEFGQFVVGKEHRLQQYIRINSPGKRDGVLKVWLDGVEVLSRSDVKYRGNVSERTALVDTFLRSTFYGGSDDTWAPSKETSIRFGDFYVYAGAPEGVSPAPVMQQPSASGSTAVSQTQIPTTSSAGQTGASSAPVMPASTQPTGTTSVSATSGSLASSGGASSSVPATSSQPPSSMTPSTLVCSFYSRSPVNADGGECGDACRQQLKDAARVIGITNFPNNLSDRSVARDFYNRIRTEGGQKGCDPLRGTVYVK